LTAALLGIIIAIGGTSGLFGIFLAEWLVRRFGFGRTFLGSAVAIGMAMVLVPLAHGSAAICSTFLIAGQLGALAWPAHTISEQSLRQAITPDRLLGRVNSSRILSASNILGSTADFGHTKSVLRPFPHGPLGRPAFEGLSASARVARVASLG
jgi:predicted MFS family arabinose efflux permease